MTPICNSREDDPCPGSGLKRCVVPVLGEGDKPADYTVRLYFAELQDARAGSRLFDVKLQGKTVLAGFDPAKEAGCSHKVVVKEFPGVRVTRDLEIKLAPNGKGTEMTILSGVEIRSSVSLACQRRLDRRAVDRIAMLLVGHLLGVPLHEQAEASVYSFEGFDDAVFAVSDDPQAVANVPHSLVMA